MLKSRKASIWFIFITVMIDMMGIGIIIPVIPTLISDLMGEGISEASRIGGWLMFAYAVMQFLFAPVLGELSDRYGRRPIILIALFGLGVDYIFHAFAPTIGWLFVGRMLAGISGASFTTANSYIADISTPETKAQNFGMVGAAFGLGFVLGPSIGGFFSKWGTQIPFLVAAGLSFLNFIYGLFVLPESLKPENRRSFKWAHVVPTGSLRHLNRYPLILSFIFAYFLIYIAGHSVQSTWSYFTMFRFDWDESMVGYSLTAVGLIVAFVQGWLVKRVVFKVGERKAVILGMILWALGLFLFAMAFKGWHMFVFIIPYCLGGIAGPTLQTIMSNQVRPDEQGELQGALTSLMSLTALIGPPLMTNLFYYFTRENSPLEFPGISFLTGGILIIVSIFIVLKPLSKLSVAKEEK